ncbi:CTD kinase subunit beta, partial [Lecanoromycetidae sp. Uapishka_2]
MAPASVRDMIDPKRVGPHPSYIEIAQPYIFQSTIQKSLAAAGMSEGKDDSIRLQGVAWIDSVRKALQLTYDTACVYYHKFRLRHPDGNGYIDAAAAALFAACKIEDTLKKSKEILCAAHNLKLLPAEQLTPDDSLFETHSKTITGLERLMLEAAGFDFRTCCPQELLIKVVKLHLGDRMLVSQTAYNISLDLYRTYVPLKQATSTMVLACLELAGRLLDRAKEVIGSEPNYEGLKTSREEVMETLLDLLDLYTHHQNSTLVGPQHALETFIGIRIALNQEASTKGATKPGLKEGTVRFMLDPQRAAEEEKTVAEFFKVEEEEYEVEVKIERKVEDAREKRRP